MKNCSTPVSCHQKKLLKVLTCLYENYIYNNTPSTDAYYLNPTLEGYALMKIELDALNSLINNYLETNKIIVDAETKEINIAKVHLWSSVAQGMVHYNNLNLSNNFGNAINNTISINSVINNVGILKTVQKLNIDECINKTYQVTPVTISEVEDDNTTYYNYTQASIVERVGCAGVSNLGFLGLSLQVPIDEAHFKNCYTSTC
jgi:hypothetical protein